MGAPHRLDAYIILSHVDTRTGHAKGRLEGPNKNDRTSMHSLFEYHARVDAILSFYIEGFLHDTLYEKGDRLFLTTETKKTALLILQKY